jgi:hypothetical protein
MFKEGVKHCHNVRQSGGGMTELHVRTVLDEGTADTMSTERRRLIRCTRA